MIRKRLLSALATGIVLFCECGAGATGTHALIFGPDVFVRDAGEATILTRTISVPNPGTGFTIEVINGHSRIDAISSATIRLNGVAVVYPSIRNTNLRSLRLDVTMNAINTLDVQLGSAPQSSLIVKIWGPAACGTVDGIIIGPDELPRPGVAVSLAFANANSTAYTSVSKSDGTFLLTDLPLLGSFILSVNDTVYLGSRFRSGQCHCAGFAPSGSPHSKRKRHR